MKKVRFLFLCGFALLIFVPLCFSDLTPQVKSVVDNRFLEPLPKSIKDFRLNGENIVKDRIGFRTPMLKFYNNMQQHVFGKLQHPLFMNGKDGHLFYGFDAYIKDFQRLNAQESAINERVHKLEFMAKKLKNKGINFLYVNMPDKKSVYAEFFPSTIWAKNEHTFSEKLEKALDETSVPHLFLKQRLIEESKTKATYNKKFDVGHYNAYGAFVAQVAIAKALGYPVPQLSEFNVDEKVIDLEPYIGLFTTETVPTLALKNRNFKLLKVDDDRVKAASQNDMPRLDQTLLVFGDSYLCNCDCFEPTNTAIDYFAKVFNKVYMFNGNAMDSIDELIEQYKPSTIIYETAERVAYLDGAFFWIVPEGEA